MTPELREKIMGCKTPAELLELVQKEGYELSDEELAEVSGGWGNDIVEKVKGGLKCPACGSYEVLRNPFLGSYMKCACKGCGHEWTTVAGVLHT